MADETDTGSLEKKEDLGPPPKADARYWIAQLNIATKTEEGWRKRADKVGKTYADTARASETANRSRAIKFNILYTNVETKKGALLPQVPKPDVRERFRTKNPVAVKAAEMLERTVSVLLEEHGWEHTAKAAVLDRCLPGRAVIRVDYDLQTEDDAEGQPKRITLQDCCPRRVLWSDFRRGPGKTWEQIGWVAFRHEVTRAQSEEMFPDIGDKLPLNLAPDKGDMPKDADPSIWKRGEVWEIHDRDKRQVVWICTDYADKPLKVEPDKLGLKDFFPIPRPLLAISRPDSQEPVEEFRQYEDQAKELEKVTRRIDKIISGLKVRGIAASVIKEFAKVASADDNQIVMAESEASLAALAQGKLNDAVWMWPLETAVKVLQELYIQRDAIKHTIYEIDGIGDILRGNVDPREKLGQSKLKASWGSRRLDMQREDVDRFLRDVIRIMAEIVAEHWDPQQLMMASGITLPTQAQKQQAAMAAQQAQQPGQPPQPPPELKELLEQPTIEEVMQLLRNDAMRRFAIDIESDQAIVGDEAQEKKDVTDFLTGMVQYWSGMAPIVQGGFPKEAAIGVFQAAARRFKFGRDVEDALDDLSEAPVPPPQPEQGDSGAAAAQAQVQAKQAETEGKLKIMQADEAGKSAEHQRNIALKDKDLAIREIDHRVAELNAKVKTGEIMAPQVAPEQPDELETETKHADLALKHAQVSKMQNEADSLGAETKDKADTGQALQAVTDTLAKILQMTQQMQQTQAQTEAAIVRALTAKKKGRRMPDGSLEVETDMGMVN